MGVLFDPRDPAARKDRLQSLARAVRDLRACDFFTLLAGDPGCAIGASFGPRTVDDFLEFADDVRAVVRRKAPRADFHVNPWAIAYWQHPTTSCETPDWWMHETALSKQMLLAPNRRWDSVNVEIPGHTAYRPLALRHLRKANLTPPDFPTPGDVQTLRRRGAGQVWAWPYFLLDEADDGDLGPAGRAVQIETRYIHRQIAHLRRVGVDTVVGNWSYAGHKPRQFNTFAFATMIRDPAATPESVIDRLPPPSPTRRPEPSPSGRCCAGSKTTATGTANSLKSTASPRWLAPSPAPNRPAPPWPKWCRTRIHHSHSPNRPRVSSNACDCVSCRAIPRRSDAEPG